MGSTSYVIQDLHKTALEKGEFHLLDSPVSGGEIGRQRRLLVIMCGGRQEVFETVKPICR